MACALQSASYQLAFVSFEPGQACTKFLAISNWELHRCPLWMVQRRVTGTQGSVNDRSLYGTMIAAGQVWDTQPAKFVKSR